MLHGRLEGVGPDDALALMHAAHEVCPYSNATRGNIDVRLLVEDDLPAVA
jgi:organic hydroperoxide reductase OsmC/OhrA